MFVTPGICVKGESILPLTSVNRYPKAQAEPKKGKARHILSAETVAFLIIQSNIGETGRIDRNCSSTGSPGHPMLRGSVKACILKEHSTLIYGTYPRSNNLLGREKHDMAHERSRDNHVSDDGISMEKPQLTQTISSGLYTISPELFEKARDS